MGKNNFKSNINGQKQFSFVRCQFVGKAPDCPYLAGFSCRHFDFNFQQFVCSHYDVSNGKFSFCCWLPSWKQNEFRDAVFCDMKLHDEKCEGV